MMASIGDGGREGGRATYLRVGHVVGDAFVGDDLRRVRPQELGDALWELGHLLMLMLLRRKCCCCSSSCAAGPGFLLSKKKRRGEPVVMGKGGRDETMRPHTNRKMCMLVARCCRVAAPWLRIGMRPAVWPGHHHSINDLASMWRVKENGTDRVESDVIVSKPAVSTYTCLCVVFD